MAMALFVISFVVLAPIFILYIALLCRGFLLGLLAPSLPHYSIYVIGKPQTGTISAAYASLYNMFC